MSVDTPRRLSALQLLLRQEAYALEAVQRELRRASEAMRSAQSELESVERRIAKVETLMRKEMSSGGTLSLATTGLRYEYLRQQSALEEAGRRARDEARREHDQVTERVQRKMLKLKGLEDAAERVTRTIRREASKRVDRRADDLWLQRRGHRR